MVAPISGSRETDIRLSLRKVSLRFGGVAALSNVSLNVRKGETVGLIGPNGAGKSTLVNCIVGLYKPDVGEIWLGQRRIDGTAPHRLAFLGISRTFQSLRLFPSLSVLENVMVGCFPRTRAGMLAATLRLRSERLEETASRTKCLALLDEFDLRRVANRPILSLPYAEQKAAEICRGLAADPEVLLLDEPAAGMSSGERANMVGVISGLSGRDLSILLIEHDVALVMQTCDRVAVLDYGVKIADGTPDEVRSDEAVINAYFGED